MFVEEELFFCVFILLLYSVLNHDYINGLLCVQTIRVLLGLLRCYFGGQWLIIVTVMEHVMNHTHFSYPFNLKQIKRFYKLSLLVCLFVLNNELM